MKTLNELSCAAILPWGVSLLSMLLILERSPAANATQYLDFTYEVVGTNVTLTKYTGPDGAVTIPGTIESVPVTTIGTQAFYYRSGLTSVTIPDSVTSIENSAFRDCTGLKSIRIPDSVTTIGIGAFEECSGLESITLPNNLTSLGINAYAYCRRLTSVTIPKSLTSIASRGFFTCINLTNVTIADGVNSIGEWTFFNCIALTSLRIPSSVTSIGMLAFEGTSNLTSVYFEGNAPETGYSVFSQGSQATVYYQYGTIGWGATFAGRPTRMSSFAPVITIPLDLGVVLEGTPGNLTAQIAGSPGPSFQWFFNGEPVVGATNENFAIVSASEINVGAYMVIASNVLGTVTNGPATLGINNVVASNFVCLVLTEPPGIPLQIQSAAQIGGPWAPLADLVLTNSPGVFIDFTATNAEQRLYRTTQPGRLQAWLYPGWSFTAPAGSQYKLEYVNGQVGFTNWQFLTNLTLPSSPYLFIDTSATNHWQRFYRTTPMP